MVMPNRNGTFLNERIQKQQQKPTQMYYYETLTVKYSGIPKRITYHSIRILYSSIYGPPNYHI